MIGVMSLSIPALFAAAVDADPAGGSTSAAMAISRSSISTGVAETQPTRCWRPNGARVP